MLLISFFKFYSTVSSVQRLFCFRDKLYFQFLNSAVTESSHAFLNFQFRKSFFSIYIYLILIITPREGRGVLPIMAYLGDSARKGYLF